MPCTNSQCIGGRIYIQGEVPGHLEDAGICLNCRGMGEDFLDTGQSLVKVDYAEVEARSVAASKKQIESDFNEICRTNITVYNSMRCVDFLGEVQALKNTIVNLVKLLKKEESF